MVAAAVSEDRSKRKYQKKQEKVELVDPGSLKPHPTNQAIYQDEPDEALLSDIEEKGIRQPIICDRETRTVISGRRRWMGAKTVGMPKVPVIFRTYDNKDDLVEAIIKGNWYRTKTQAQILREVEALMDIERRKARARKVRAGKVAKAKQIAMNQGLGHEAATQVSGSAGILTGGVDSARDRIGKKVGQDGRSVQRAIKVIDAAKAKHGRSWKKDENVQAIFDGKKTIVAAARDTLKEEKRETIEKKAAKITDPVGDVRCKDNIDDVPDESVDHVMTDPPYGVASEFEAQFGDRAPMASDFEDCDGGKLELKEIMAWCLEWSRVLRTGGNIAVCTSDKYLSFIMEGLRLSGIEHLQAIPWHKTNPEPSVRQIEFCSSCEYIVVGCKGSKRTVFNWLGQNEMHNFVEGPICGGKERMGHPTQKPLWLMQWLLERLTVKGDIVLDNFAGTGTTAVACKKLDRQFIVVEKSRKHVSTIKVRLSS
jgi:site-specific DNA-methyltransferase (adenine-specific)/modification methylase